MFLVVSRRQKKLGQTSHHDGVWRFEELDAKMHVEDNLMLSVSNGCEFDTAEHRCERGALPVTSALLDNALSSREFTKCNSSQSSFRIQSVYVTCAVLKSAT